MAIPMKRKYHYEWAAYTDNLGYGRIFLARGLNRDHVAFLAHNAKKGCYVIRRERVYDN